MFFSSLFVVGAAKKTTTKKNNPAAQEVVEEDRAAYMHASALTCAHARIYRSPCTHSSCSATILFLYWILKIAGSAALVPFLVPAS